MADDSNDTLAGSPEDAAAGTVKRPPGPSGRPGTAADEAPPKPGEGTIPAGQRNTGFGGEKQGADHDTEEAAAYRENDA